MNRASMLDAARSESCWDIAIIGGGATGLGAAVDAASRGLRTILLEASDFAKGTSSRSTKLAHGGVRYLQQGNVSLVMEALRERGIMRRNAPHLVHDLAFVVPSYEWWQSPFYGIGLRVYDMLAGRYGFGPSRHLTRREVIDTIPLIQQDGLRGGTQYYDGQFDDARFAIALARTAADRGATLLNYAPVTGLRKNAGGEVEAVEVSDALTGDELVVRAKIFINATGPFADAVRRMDHAQAPALIAPSRGTHVVLDRSFLAGDSAIMVPHTTDGRVLFAIPWQGVTVVGTTDVAIESIDLEPVPSDEEIAFILETANNYLSRPANRSDIRSVFAGIRPLVRAGDATRTASLSREHTIVIDPESALITVAGGKWTTYRKMAEDVVDHAVQLAQLAAGPCITEDLPLHGSIAGAHPDAPLCPYGSDADAVAALAQASPDLSPTIHPRLPLTRAEVLWFCRHEMAQAIDDVLARRSRSLLIDARAAIEAAATVGQLMAQELGRDHAWIDRQVDAFCAIATSYLPQP